MSKKTIYLDHASTTPLDKKVFKAMNPYFSEKFANPNNLYASARIAKEAINASAKKIASAINSSPNEIIFTASATEADNLAVLGIARANKTRGKKIIISAIEHKGIHSAAKALVGEGFEVVDAPVAKDGLINIDKFQKLLGKDVVLVSVVYADSETGTVQSIEKIAGIIKDFRKKNNFIHPFFHTDASQAFSYADINVERLGVDAMSFSAHKIYGPKGVGALYIKRGTPINPVIFGGGHEHGLRSGTQNVPAIIGFGESVELARKNKNKESCRVRKLRDKLEKGIFKNISKTVLNGHPEKRLPNFLNVSFLDIEGEAMLLYLDNEGIEVSTGSACDSETLEPSRVLLAQGRPYEHVHGSIRFSLGRHTTDGEISYVLKKLPVIVKKLRLMSPLDMMPREIKAVSQPKAFVGGQTPHFLRKKK